MNERLRTLMLEAGYAAPELAGRANKLAELIVEAVLDQVKERAYYTGDRDWSDEVDRQWIQLEFGYGALADAKKGIFK
jgi:hypothetical protein